MNPSAETDLKPLLDKMNAEKSFNHKAFDEAIKGANSNRQTVAVWSPTISAILWYLKKTIPEFSISDEARTILEEGLEKKYPDLFQKVMEEMNQSRANAPKPRRDES